MTDTTVRKSTMMDRAAIQLGERIRRQLAPELRHLRGAVDDLKIAVTVALLLAGIAVILGMVTLFGTAGK